MDESIVEGNVDHATGVDGPRGERDVERACELPGRLHLAAFLVDADEPVGVRRADRTTHELIPDGYVDLSAYDERLACGNPAADQKPPALRAALRRSGGGRDVAARLSLGPLGCIVFELVFWVVILYLGDSRVCVPVASIFPDDLIAVVGDVLPSAYIRNTSINDEFPIGVRSVIACREGLSRC